jgi:HK97 family phage portal protein
MVLRGNAYLYKIKVNGRVTALYPVNPACVCPDYSGAAPRFELKDREYGPVVDEVGKDRIIHMPGLLLEDPYVGVSLVEAHRHSLGNELGRQRFEGRYIANDASAGVVLNNPGNTTAEQRADVRASWEAKHAGANNAGRPAVIWGGWTVDHMPVTLQDAQFIESKRYSVQDMGRMLGIPSGLLNDPDAPGGDSPEQENMRLLQHGVTPWMERVEQGVETDVDLFKVGEEMEFGEEGFLRADIQTRWNAYRLGRQGGWITANEIRLREGLPPVANGDEIQETPVGGAANQSSNTGTTDGSSDA